MSYITTVTGSYPRKEVQKDTLRKSSVSEEESFDMIKWEGSLNSKYKVAKFVVE